MSKMYKPEAYRTVNYLTIIGQGDDYISPSGVHSKTSICRCVCDKVLTILSNNIKSGSTKSCGCMKNKIIAVNTSRILLGSSKYRWSTSIYRHESIAYRDMIHRCYHKINKSYHNYGGRGITVCERWLDPIDGWDHFQDDMHHLYSEGLQLERLDNNGNYCPENCNYVTAEEQANNRRDNVYLTINGVTQTGTQWGRQTNNDPHSILFRKRIGWSDHDCVFGKKELSNV